MYGICDVCVSCDALCCGRRPEADWTGGVGKRLVMKIQTLDPSCSSCCHWLDVNSQQPIGRGRRNLTLLLYEQHLSEGVKRSSGAHCHSVMAVVWNPNLYLRNLTPRIRPALDLLKSALLALPPGKEASDVEHILDLGCGPGTQEYSLMTDALLYWILI